MPRSRTIDLAENLDGEWIAPQQIGYPAVPTAEDAQKLAVLELMAQKAASYIDTVDGLVNIGRKEIEATGGTNILHIHVSPRRATIEQRTPFWHLLEGRIVVDFPPELRPELPSG